MKQLERKDIDSIENLEPAYLGSAIIKKKSAQWLVDLFEYLAGNPHYNIEMDILNLELQGPWMAILVLRKTLQLKFLIQRMMNLQTLKFINL